MFVSSCFWHDFDNFKMVVVEGALLNLRVTNLRWSPSTKNNKTHSLNMCACKLSCMSGVIMYIEVKWSAMYDSPRFYILYFGLCVKVWR